MTSSCQIGSGSIIPEGDYSPTDQALETQAVYSTKNWWEPIPGSSWQWQLSGLPVDLTVSADIYDLDLFDTDVTLIKELHARGSKVICYISVGSWEDWRPDAQEFPPEVIGRKYQGWKGERWLDIRQIELLKPVLSRRFDLCQQKGFDGVEPDNIDGYTNRTGFPLTSQDQLRFNRWIAEEAHSRQLAIALKNDPEQVEALLPIFDFAISEDCFADQWCEEMLPFLRSGKAVLAAEYSDTGIKLEDICHQAEAWRISLVLKNRELDAFRQACTPR